MKLKLLIAGWIVSRLEKRARLERRACRDYQRQEWKKIHRVEQRSRGLRIYIGWSKRREHRLPYERSPDWQHSLQPGELTPV